MSDDLRARLIAALEIQTRCCLGMCKRSATATQLIAELQQEGD